MSQTVANTILANAPVGVALTSTDLSRSIQFYRDALGLPVEPEDGAFHVRCGGNTEIYVYERDEPPLATNTVAAFRVNDLPATVEALRNNGVVFEEYDMPGLKTENGIAAMGNDQVAWFKDPDGNILAIGTQ